MSQNNVTRLVQPGTFSDLLTNILRDGARTLLAQAVEADVAAFTAKHADLKQRSAQLDDLVTYLAYIAGKRVKKRAPRDAKQ